MPSTGCLGADTLVELLEGRADTVTFDRALAHASTCETCRGLLSSLARNETVEQPPGTRTDRDSQPPTLVEGMKPGRPSGLDLGSRVDRYELVRLIGAGGMGYVYAARDPELDRLVALKLLRPDLGGTDAQLRLHERLRREAQAMAQLAHPNVVAVHDVGAYEDRVFVAMEYIEGDTLAYWVDGKTPRQILDAYIAAGQGLAAAHAGGLVHRDFKPENVLVGLDGRVRVSDFGLARTLDKRIVSKTPRPVGDDLELTRTGLAIGTPLYMAPEQFSGENADKRSDQFSFCVALHGAIYGTRPFAGDTFEDLAESVLSGTITEPTRRVRLPRRARAAIRRGLSLEPRDRWPSMDDLLVELAAKPVRWPWLAVPAVGVAAAAMIGFVLTRGDAPPCDRHNLAAVWNAAKKSEIRAALVATKLPYAAATATAIERAGDRFAATWTTMRVGACEAHQAGDLGGDAFALQGTCLALRRRDLEALAARLVAITPELAPRAAGAIDTLVPVDVCDDRAMLQLLVGPNAPSVRLAINRLIGALHEVRGALALADPTLMPRVTELVASARAIEMPAVRAEVLDVCGRYAQAIGDLAHARDWLAQAADDAALGRHDLAEASARTALVTIQAELGAGSKELRSAADLAVRRLHDHPELAIANALASTRMTLEDDKAEDVARRAAEAATLADSSYAPDDLRRVEPHRTLARMLDRAGKQTEAHAERARVEALLRRLLGDDHPAIASILVDAGDAERDPVVVDPIFARAEVIAKRAGDHRAEADVVAHQASYAAGRSRYAIAAKLYARAMQLDGNATTPDAIDHAQMAAVIANEHGDHAAAIALIKHTIAMMQAAWPADAPRRTAFEQLLTPR